jgi:hypothetical protein
MVPSRGGGPRGRPATPPPPPPLVVDGPEPLGQLAGRHLLAGLAADEHRLVAHSHPAAQRRHVDQALVHGDGAHLRAAPAPHQHVHLVREPSAQSVPVAHGQGRDQRRALRAEGVPVAQSHAGGHLLEQRDARLPLEHRTQLRDAGVRDLAGGGQAVDRDARPHGVEGAARQVEERRAVGHVVEADALVARGLAHPPEALELLQGIGLVRLVGSRKVAHQSAHAQAGELAAALEEGRHLLGLDPDPPHAGVDHDVHRDLPAGPARRARERLDPLRRAHRGLEALLHEGLALLGQGEREHHEAGLDARPQQLERLCGVGHAERVTAESHEVVAHDPGVVAVGVGLDGRPQRTPSRQLAEQRDVVLQVLQVDEGPRQVPRVFGHGLVTPHRGHPRSACARSGSPCSGAAPRSPGRTRARCRRGSLPRRPSRRRRRSRWRPPAPRRAGRAA